MRKDLSSVGSDKTKCLRQEHAYRTGMLQRARQAVSGGIVQVYEPLSLGPYLFCHEFQAYSSNIVHIGFMYNNILKGI